MSPRDKPKRKAIALKTKLASALLTMLRPDENGTLVPVIPYTEAKGMDEDSIISRFEFQHIIPVAHYGTNHPANIEPMPKKEHREITAKIDIPRIAKAKRLDKKQEAFRQRLLAKDTGEVPPPPKKKAPWPKGRKLRSKGFDRRRPTLCSGRGLKQRGDADEEAGMKSI